MSFEVFGYGSLVNKATLPPFRAARTATLEGYVRAWNQTSPTAAGGACWLSVLPCEGARIDGLVITFEDDMWPAVAAREKHYDPLTGDDGVIVFRAKPENERFGDEANPVRLSYIDVTLKGFLQTFGAAGAARFMESTRGWHVPILNDRAAPGYVRAVQLSDTERAIVDRLLESVDAVVIDEAQRVSP